ncbi:hypothetical protein E1J61_13435 [Cupriavidus sp. L7L]|nr:hypothetical protein E1J61_13435 [Cupriavidus sp. L7L]
MRLQARHRCLQWLPLATTPSFRAGRRFWVVRDRVQVDTTYGNVFGGGTGERFFTIGLRLLLSPAFLP